MNGASGDSSARRPAWSTRRPPDRPGDMSVQRANGEGDCGNCGHTCQFDVTIYHYLSWLIWCIIALEANRTNAAKGWLVIRIDHIVCPVDIEDKLAMKHQVTLREARQVLLAQPRIRFAEKGNVPGEDVYAAFGQTYGGRYLAVFFVYKRSAVMAIIISARDMVPSERRQYGRK